LHLGNAFAVGLQEHRDLRHTANGSTPIALIRDLCRSAWGVDGHFTAIASERDEIFRVDQADGRAFVLKLTNPQEPPETTEFQTRAMLHAIERDPTLPIPRLIPDRSGRHAFRPDWDGDHVPTARLLTWLAGPPLASAKPAAPIAAAMGAILARLGLALADFDHAGADQDLAWDICRAPQLTAELSGLSDPAMRAIVENAFTRFDWETAPCLNGMRRQIIHNDLTPHNTLVDPQHHDRIAGVIDFGDLVRTALVCDPAIAACYLMGDGDDAMALPQVLVAAYHAERPLDRAEIELIPLLMEVRHAMTVAITENHAARRPEAHAYITKNTATAHRGLQVFKGRPPEMWVEGFLRCCGMEG